MNKVFSRIIAIACMVALTVTALPATGLRAEDDTPGTPSITVKAVNGTDVEVTFGKTSEADGYEVWITSDCGYTGYKNKISERYEYYYNDNPGDYINAATVEEDGTAVRTVTIKNLSNASVSVKVRAYNVVRYNRKKNNVYYSEFSEAQTIQVTAQKKGYKTSYNFSKVKKGDTIKFGTYEQDYPVNGKDPIEWVVLDKTKNGIVVMSKYALDALPYNTESLEDLTWETCTLRKWLNEKFYYAAFNKTEKAMIRKTTVHNNDNPYYGTGGGNDTEDKVFLLSVEDALKESYGFEPCIANDINRRCAPSDYAIAQGVEYKTIDYDKRVTSWWLRTPDSDDSKVALVYSSGSISSEYDHIYASFTRGVRPVMVLKLKS